MENQKTVMNDKKRKVLIVICAVVLILLILFIFFMIARSGKNGKTTTTDGSAKMKGIYIDNAALVEADHYVLTSENYQSKCLGNPNICLDYLEVIRYNGHGLIKYQLNNHSGSALTGNVRLTLIVDNPEENLYQTEMFILPYRALGQGARMFYYGFDGWSTFPVESISDFEIQAGAPADAEALYDNLSEEQIGQITIS